MNWLQDAYNEFIHQTPGRGNKRDVIDWEFRRKMAENQRKVIKGPDANSAYFKAGGRGDVNSLKNKWG
jgi:hypothetical protein